MKRFYLAFCFFGFVAVPALGGIPDEERFAVFEFPQKAATCAELLAHQHVTDLVYLKFLAAIQFSQLPPLDAVASEIVEIFRLFDYPEMDLGFLEQVFRKRGLPIHLVAENASPGAEYVSPKDFSPRKYWVTFHIHREQIAAARKEQLGVSDSENIDRLNQAGFLIQKPAPKTKKGWNWFKG